MEQILLDLQALEEKEITEPQPIEPKGKERVDLRINQKNDV